MDEPFSALDVLTAESLRSEVYGLWSKGELGLKSLLLITHLIEEAVFLGDRIVIMGANPGTIREVIANPLPHPRDYRSASFQELVDRVHQAITQIHLPDQVAVEGAPGGRPRPEPLPAAQIGEVIGLLEVVHDGGDRIDLFSLASRLRLDLGRAILVVKAAEMVDLIETPRQDVLLTREGREFVAGDVNARKRIFHRCLLGVPLFAHVVEILRRAPDLRVPAETLQEDFVLHLPDEDPEVLFETLVAWGRYGELIGYEPEARQVYLDTESTAAPGAADAA
jgi:NitT/TauT family transport system ATP-binding protein